MENAHNKDAVIGRDVENAVPLTIVLKERTAPPHNHPAQRGRFGDALETLLKSKIVALGLL